MIPTEEKAYVTKNGKRHLSEFQPKFDAFVYSLESFVPLVKLGVSDHWRPDPNRAEALRNYLFLHMSFGWILSAL
jgi:hypothetical protein